AVFGHSQVAIDANALREQDPGLYRYIVQRSASMGQHDTHQVVQLGRNVPQPGTLSDGIDSVLRSWNPYDSNGRATLAGYWTSLAPYEERVQAMRSLGERLLNVNSSNGRNEAEGAAHIAREIVASDPTIDPELFHQPAREFLLNPDVDYR